LEPAQGTGLGLCRVSGIKCGLETIEISVMKNVKIQVWSTAEVIAMFSLRTFNADIWNMVWREVRLAVDSKVIDQVKIMVSGNL